MHASGGKRNTSSAHGPYDREERSRNCLPFPNLEEFEEGIAIASGVRVSWKHYSPLKKKHTTRKEQFRRKGLKERKNKDEDLNFQAVS